ncbi:MAG: zf-TFIIB domain-containing protein [Candidatus Moranbacteria bacterium]|nr:zf-TFIIB domain-containing protein [Candidatus Moranbacteria bacterium]
MSPKNCPVCAIPMREIKAESTYDTPVFIDQCDTCGGLWFDGLEIYRIRIGEAHGIYGVDKDKLRLQTDFQTEHLRCPDDGSVLGRFKDPSFPDTLHIGSCPTCSGFWLNRGEFVEFQKAREEIIGKNTATEQRNISGKRKEFDEQIQRMMALNSVRSDSMKHFADFLSTPIDPMTNRPISDSDNTRGANLAIDIAFGVLRLVYYLFTK